MSHNVYSASISTPDGLHISVNITAPSDRRDVDELSELAQMAVVRAKPLIARNDARNEEVPF